MTDFDGPFFSKGPYQWVFDRGLAPQLFRKANLETLRMYLHTLQRHMKWGYAGAGVPGFDEAYRSGGLKAIVDRLDELIRAKDQSLTF